MPVNVVIIVRVNEEDEDDDDDVRSLLQCATRRGDKRGGRGKSSGCGGESIDRTSPANPRRAALNSSVGLSVGRVLDFRSHSFTFDSFSFVESDRFANDAKERWGRRREGKR